MSVARVVGSNLLLYLLCNLRSSWCAKMSESAAVDHGGSCFPTGAAAAQNLLPCAQQFLKSIPAPPHKQKESALPATLYVIHAQKLVSRKQNLQRIFTKSGIDEVDEVVWLDQFENSDIQPATSACLFQPQYGHGSAPGYGPANAWAQYSLYYDMVQKETPFVFVMEDDPDFDAGGEQSFKKDLIDIIAKAKEFLTGYDFIHFGGCWNIHGTTPEGGPFKSGPAGRCNHGYVVSLSGAQKMLALLRKDAPASQAKISDNVDLLFNHIMSGKLLVSGCLPLSVFMLEPPLLLNDSARGHWMLKRLEKKKHRRLVKIEAP